MGAPRGITAAQPASSSLRHSTGSSLQYGSTVNPSATSSFAARSVSSPSGRSVFGSLNTSSFTSGLGPPISSSRASRSVRTASSAVKHPAVLGSSTHSLGIQCSSDFSPCACRSSRRTATVTICAPDAAMAFCMVGKSLYLPVPTTSREVNRCSPRESSSDMPLSSAHESDDLQHVSRGELLLGVPRSLHHRPVALHGHALGAHAEVPQQAGHGEPVGQLGAISV